MQYNSIWDNSMYIKLWSRRRA